MRSEHAVTACYAKLQMELLANQGCAKVRSTTCVGLYENEVQEGASSQASMHASGSTCSLEPNWPCRRRTGQR